MAVTVAPSVRKVVRERDAHTCQWCGARIRGNDYSLQHRRAKGMGGSRLPTANGYANLILVCGSATTGCHGYIEGNRVEARERGFNLYQAGPLPADIPLQVIDVRLGMRRGWIRLGEDKPTRIHLTTDTAEQLMISHGYILENPMPETPQSWPK